MLIWATDGTGHAKAEGGTISASAGSEKLDGLSELPGPEIESARTATSDTYRLNDGADETRIYSTPINYRTRNGLWLPIEEELEPDSDGSGFTNGANSFELELPERLGAEPTRIVTAVGSVSDRLLGSPSEPADVEDDTATYEADSTGTSVEVSSVASGVKESIELSNPSQPNTFRYELDASSGLEPSLEGDGSVIFRHRGGSVAMRIPAPTISDGGAAAPPDQKATRYGLKQLANGNWELTLFIEKAWLEASQRVWPVIVDPSIFVGTGGGCDLEKWEPQGGGEGYQPGNCASPTEGEKMEAGYFTYGNTFFRRRPIFSTLALANIPASADVKSASLNLYKTSSASTTLPEAPPEAVQAWAITSKWGRSAAWTYRITEEPGGALLKWVTPGGDFDAEGGEIHLAGPGTEEGWRSIPNLREFAQKRISGSLPNYGLLVKVGNETPCSAPCTRGRFDFYNQNGPAALRPYLSVDYFAQAPLSSKLISPTEGTRTARRLKLKSRWSTAGVEGIIYQYREGKSGAFQDIPAELVSNAEGKAVSWPAPTKFGSKESESLYLNAAHLTPTIRRTGGTIQLRAIFEGPSEVAGYSAPVEAKVDRYLGGPKDANASVGPGSVDLLTGNFTTSHSDVSIPTFNSSLGFTRSFNSRRPVAAKGSAQEVEEATSVLGPGWKPGVSLEEEGGSSWSNLKTVEESGSYEEEVGQEEVVVREYSFAYAVLTTTEGDQLAFEKQPNGTYSAPPEVTGWTLTVEEGTFVLADPGGNRTTFSNLGVENEYVPTAISQPSSGVGATSARVGYELKEVGGKKQKRIHMIVAPPPPGVSCNSQAEATTTSAGCRALILGYLPATHWGAPAADGERLASITYYAPGNGGPWEVAKYEYNSEGRLTEEWDPRIVPSLKERYSYEAGGALRTITPPGLEPWTLEYGAFDEEEGNGRLIAVKRPSLLSSPTTAQTTIAYGVPTSGAGAPYEMSGSTVAQWGQTDVPADATAIFPPDQVPTSPPSSFSHAILYYMDSEGREVNSATASGGGTSNPAISTTESDEYGNLVRELTPQNRLRVLEKSPEARKGRWEELETRRSFGAEGTQMEEEEGPMHTVRLASGISEPARFRKIVQYDHGIPAGTTPDPHLPTRETSGARVGGELKEERVTETEYDWTLRRPTKTIVVMGPGKPNIESVTVYNDQTGLPEQLRQPKNKAGGGAGTTKTVYFTPSGTENVVACQSSRYAGLPCRIEPAKQPGTSGQPELLVKSFRAYDAFGEPEETVESPGGSTEHLRKTNVSYDNAGRPLIQKIEGGGAAVLPTETTYNEYTGLPTKQQFTSGSNRETTSKTYNALGQITEYQDADGNKAKTTYDVDGRPLTVTDNRGSQTVTYDPASGLPTRLEDSAAGTFTASYDADGNMVERNLPDGLSAKTTFNETDEATKLSYTKASNCGTSCTWLEESLERSIFGQILSNSGSLVNDRYSYDRDGRLTEAQETPATSSGCTTRQYSYDEDSNRLSRTVRPPGVGGICVTSGSTPQSYSYDEGDRLLGEGLTYDEFGRITNLPAVDAGGKALTTTYYGTNMVATQAQNGITNNYELDASGRQRARLQGGGGLEGTEVFHYDGPSDSPAWTERAGKWTRDVFGIGGELVALQESTGGVTLQLTNTQGSVVASAEPAVSATKLKATSVFDEFGEPITGNAARFGWLGGKARRTELPSGVIQMGARSYIPQLGRFLTPDPVRGGSANPYDYANQDPVNMFDLNGECAHPGRKKCLGPPTPAATRQAVRHANKTRTLTVTFSSRQGAERFSSFLEAGGHWVERIVSQAGEWNERAAREVEAKARAVAKEEAIFGPPPPPPSGGGGTICTGISTGFGTAGVGFGIVPGGQVVSAGSGVIAFVADIAHQATNC